jgi:hypothetical protein
MMNPKSLEAVHTHTHTILLIKKQKNYCISYASVCAFFEAHKFV